LRKQETEDALCKDHEELKARFEKALDVIEAMNQKQESQVVKIESLEGKIEALETKLIEQEAALKKAAKKQGKKDDEPTEQDSPAPEAQ